MSADNWAKCPRCKANRIKAADAAQAAALAAYGKVDVAEFDRLRAHADELSANVETGTETFREDYEIYGAEEGVVLVGYSGRCTVCGLSLSFEHSHPLG